MRIFHLIILSLYLVFNLNAQISIGISIGGIGIHSSKDSNYDLYKWKLDRKGKVVAYSAITFLVAYRINEYIGIKLQETSIFSDCAGKYSNVAHIGINFYDDIIGIKSSVNEFSMSCGPLLYSRKNWNKMPGYNNNPDFVKLSPKGIWENKFVWHGGQIEYSRNIISNYDFTLNIFPGYPHFATFGLGGKVNY